MTSTAIATTKKDNVQAKTEWNRSQIDLLKRTIFKKSSDEELQLFLHYCKKTQLDPFSRQVYAIPRYDKSLGKEVLSFQISIDGLRLIAERTGKYSGQDSPLWCGKDGVWKDVWISNETPYAAKVSVYRNDFKMPITAVAKFESYCQKNPTWQKMPDIMIAKCAESLALRKAFPHELSGIYTNDEMGNESDNQVHHPELTKQHPTANSNEDLEKNLRADVEWMQDKVGYQTSADYTWDELSHLDPELTATKDGVEKTIGGRAYLHQLAAWKQKPEIAIKAKIALELGKNKALAENKQQDDVSATSGSVGN